MAMDTPAQRLDKELKVALSRFHRLRWMMVGVLAVIVAIAVAAGAVTLVRQNHQLNVAHTQASLNRARILSSCDFYRPLTPLPVTVLASGRPTELSVQIIAAAREAYIGQGCPGRIPPPDPSLLHWAAYFHVPVRG